MASVAETITYSAKSPAKIPWYLWCSALAVTSASIGGRWDVSWHQSIGRDTFWTPAHIAIYLCGVLAGIACGYLILKATFQRPTELVATSVQVMGLSGPLGAFLAAWGGLAMLTSAPFDNWWHSAYGLDVKIVSPPHTLLILGDVAIEAGALLLVMSALNRAEGQPILFSRLRRLVLYLSSVLLMSVMFFCMEYTRDVQLHTSLPYIALSIGVPVCLAATSRASRYRWAATSIAALYTASVIGFILILPLFPAEPKLGPVYQPVTHFVPPQFPLLLLVPAILLDLLWTRVGSFGKEWAAVLSGPLFVFSLLAVEWPFASFLMTPASNNRFFATGSHTFFVPSWAPVVLRQFVRNEQPLALVKSLEISTVCAAISVWLGLTVGDWMRKIQR
jgi:hypothetical protein